MYKSHTTDYDVILPYNPSSNSQSNRDCDVIVGFATSQGSTELDLSPSIFLPPAQQRHILSFVL